MQFVHNKTAREKLSKEDVQRGVTRVLHMIESSQERSSADRVKFASSVEALVCMYLNGIHTQLFGLELLSERYTWSPKCLHAICLYADFQNQLCRKRLLTTDAPILGKYCKVLDQFKDDLKGGIAKRLSIAKTSPHIPNCVCVHSLGSVRAVGSCLGACCASVL